MIDSKALIAIRAEHDLSQAAFADRLGYKVSYIQALEDHTNKREQATSSFISKLRDEFGLHDAPLTISETDKLTEDLHRWKDLIDYGEMQKAEEAMPDLAKRAKLSFRRCLQCLYDLYAARYYQNTGDKRPYKRLMKSLSERQPEFTEICSFLYHHLVAVQAHTENRLHDAHAAFDKAERIDKEDKWGGLPFCYQYGICLSYMGYAAKAIGYLERAMHKAKWSTGHDGKINRRYDLHILCVLAKEYSKIGRMDDAIAILDERFKYDTKRGTTSALGFIYHSYGEIYHKMEDYGYALDNYEEAFKYHEEGSEPYIDSLFHKAITLIACDMIDEALDCISKGMRSSRGEVWKALFDALKHSVSLSDPASLEYMEKVAIPNLLKHGQYEEATSHHEKICKFYEHRGNHKKAYEHIRAMYNIQKKQYEDRVERGV